MLRTMLNCSLMTYKGVQTDIFRCTNRYIQVYKPIYSVKYCVSLQDDFNSISAWTRDWQLAFNNDNCVVLRVRINNDFIHSIDGKALNCVKELGNLGVIITDTLKPPLHIHNIA